MKSYLSALLLLLLLVEKSLSAGISRMPRKVVSDRIRRKMYKYKWENDMINMKQMFSPPEQTNTPPPNQIEQQPNAPPQQISGLSSIKEYFYSYGYLQSFGPFDDYLDKQTISAITTYQNNFNLQATGNLNDETLEKISLLRCAVPDINFNYNFIDDVSWPKAGNWWFPKGKNLTYSFLPVSKIPPNVTMVFANTFTQWAQAIGVVSLTETTYDNADIKVGFYNFGEDIKDEVVGGSFVRSQPGSDVKTGEIRLDGNMYWLLPNESNSSWEDGVLDFESVVLHQIGHLLGLDHSNNEDSIMYPYILPSQPKKVQLSDSDKENIQQQYTNDSPGYSGRWGVFLVTTLSLGFA